ncbi:hypothetical protein BB560_004846, partial [Smittium megazygosporum]
STSEPTPVKNLTLVKSANGNSATLLLLLATEESIRDTDHTIALSPTAKSALLEKPVLRSTPSLTTTTNSLLPP